ncbi:histidine phosphatase family protein [Kaarinaea lacus]
MEIVVIRHGKSIVDPSGSVNAREFGVCTREYDELGVCGKHLPDQKTIERVAKCKFTICSDLSRSIQSAKLLGLEEPGLISSLYRECEIPYTDWLFPKLSKTKWAMIFRIFQLMGYSPNAESYKQALNRSKACAVQLEQLSFEYGSVLYVGHGALIWLIHRQLLSSGWLGPRKSAREHWEYGVYRYNET